MANQAETEIYLNLLKCKEPPLLMRALKDYGLTEEAGKANNPKILRMAQRLKVDWYKDDSTPWCGLIMGYWCWQIGLPFNPNKLLAAREWLNYGKPVKRDTAGRGDILVFSRDGGGHVGLYAGETTNTYWVFGGNQGDTVKPTQIAKDRLIGARRPIYAKEYKAARVVYADGGIRSLNEK